MMRSRTLLYLAITLTVLHPNQSFAIIESWNNMAVIKRATRNQEVLTVADTEEKGRGERAEIPEGWPDFWEKIFFRV